MCSSNYEVSLYYVLFFFWNSNLFLKIYSRVKEKLVKRKRKKNFCKCTLVIIIHFLKIGNISNFILITFAFFFQFIYEEWSLRVIENFVENTTMAQILTIDYVEYCLFHWFLATLYCTTTEETITMALHIQTALKIVGARAI